jgi:3-deoxy-7-phosphoheptulonate synthase
LTVAINALHSAAMPHSFLGINPSGECAVIRTRGNPYGHVVLRGGSQPNYDSVTIALCETELAKNKLPQNIVVDCSHANSNKDPALQALVMNDCVRQILEGNESIVGLMIESNISGGNQSIPEDLSKLKYGVSVTDACVDWATTERMLREAHEKLQEFLPQRR